MRIDIITLHPALLERPYLGNTASLDHWVEYVKRGMEDWDSARDGTNLASTKPPPLYEVFRSGYIEHFSKIGT